MNIHQTEAQDMGSQHKTGYKMTELGEIPVDWEVVKLGELIRIKHGYAFTGANFTKNKNENILLTPGNFEIAGGIKFDWEKQKYYTGEVPVDFILKQNDLIVAMTDLTQDCNILGSPAFIPDSKFNYLHNQRLGLVQITDRPKLGNKFLYHYLNHRIYRLHLKNSKTGTTVSHTSPKTIYEVKTILPPLPEQTRIAAILSTVDEKIELIEGQIAETQALKQGLMQRLLSRGIGHSAFKDSELGEIPVGWEVRKLGEVGKIVMGQSPSGDSYNKSQQGMPILNGPTEFTQKYPIPVQYTTQITKTAIAGDVLFCVRGSTTGRMNVADQDYCIGRGLAAIRGGKKSTTKYLYFILQNLAKEVLRKAKDMGSTFPNVNSKEMYQYQIPLPPLPEQQQIAHILSSVDEKLAVLQERKAATQELKKGLMQQLLTGKVRVKLGDE